MQAHRSPYCAASRHAIDLALLCYHLLFLTFPSQRVCCIYFLLTSCLFSLSCVPSHWGLAILYCLPYSTISSICFRQVITLAPLTSWSFISFTSQPSSAHLSWPFLKNIFLLCPSFLVVYRLCVASSLLSSSLFTSHASPPFLQSSRVPYFVLGNPVSQAHLHDYAAVLLIGSREIIRAECDVSDWNGPQSNKITLPIPNLQTLNVFLSG